MRSNGTRSIASAIRSKMHEELDNRIIRGLLGMYGKILVAAEVAMDERHAGVLYIPSILRNKLNSDLVVKQESQLGDQKTDSPPSVTSGQTLVRVKC